MSRSLRVVSPSRRWSARVYVADSVPNDFSGWGSATGTVDQRRSVHHQRCRSTKKRGSVVLLWITQLGPKADGQQLTRVILQEVTPRG